MLQLDIMQITFKAMMHHVGKDWLRWDAKVNVLCFVVVAVTFLQAVMKQKVSKSQIFCIVMYIQREMDYQNRKKNVEEGLDSVH